MAKCLAACTKLQIQQETLRIMASGDPEKGKDQASGPIAFEVERYGSDIINNPMLKLRESYLV